MGGEGDSWLYIWFVAKGFLELFFSALPLDWWNVLGCMCVVVKKFKLFESFWLGSVNMMLTHKMFWLLFKTNRFHFAVGLALITHRGHQNMVTTSVTLWAVLLCSHNVLTSSVCYWSTDAAQNGIYLLNKMMCKFNMMYTVCVRILRLPTINVT